MLKYTLEQRFVKNEYQIVFTVENEFEESIIRCPDLDKQGTELLFADIKEFIEDNIDDSINLIVVQNSGEEDPLGVIVDLYEGEEDPTTCTFWFEDYEPDLDIDKEVWIV